jgi:hypothetical protein
MQTASTVDGTSRRSTSSQVSQGSAVSFWPLTWLRYDSLDVCCLDNTKEAQTPCNLGHIYASHVVAQMAEPPKCRCRSHGAWLSHNTPLGSTLLESQPKAGKQPLMLCRADQSHFTTAPWSYANNFQTSPPLVLGSTHADSCTKRHCPQNNNPAKAVFKDTAANTLHHLSSQKSRTGYTDMSLAQQLTLQATCRPALCVTIQCGNISEQILAQHYHLCCTRR